ncbi:MAG TPA: VTT domain-containing protein [Blattabacteriaceae bacterium]|jgi:membrane protein YqaA with SNARE-associated domain|nr:VTT domain-containing protein [Blattabacteriaceae bacterium]
MIVPLFILLSLGSWLERLGGVGLILLGLADNSVVPMPGSMDALTIVLSAHQKSWWPYYAVMATIGGIVGAYVTYGLGFKSGEQALEKKLPKKKAERIYKLFKRYGFWSLFVPGLLPPPVPYSPFLIVAGALKYPKRYFLVAVGVARAIRYGLLAWLGSIYSKQIFGFFQHYYRPMLWTVVTLAVIGGVGALYWWWKRRREGKPVIPDAKEPSTRTA